MVTHWEMTGVGSTYFERNDIECIGHFTLLSKELCKRVGGRAVRDSGRQWQSDE